MAKTKAKQSKPLKDFDIVAYVVPLSPIQAFPELLVDGRPYCKNSSIHALYLNRYGCEIGALVREEETGEYMSWDPWIWEEYLHYKYEDDMKRLAIKKSEKRLGK